MTSGDEAPSRNGNINSPTYKVPFNSKVRESLKGTINPPSQTNSSKEELINDVRVRKKIKMMNPMFDPPAEMTHERSRTSFD